MENLPPDNREVPYFLLQDRDTTPHGWCQRGSTGRESEKHNKMTQMTFSGKNFFEKFDEKIVIAPSVDNRAKQFA